MVLFTTSQEWLHHSAMLLEARPESTRISTSYSIKPAKPSRKATSTTTTTTSADPPSTAPAPTSTSTTSPQKPPRGRLILKTYDPVSGACLRYRTTKAAEVSRLIQMLGTLGRRMAAVPGLPPACEEDGRVLEGSSAGVAGAVGSVPAVGAVVADVGAAVVGAAGGAVGVVKDAAAAAAATGSGSGAGGAKAKKKKGKR